MFWPTPMYAGGGPLLPKISMVMRLPVLQHGHLRNKIVFVFVAPNVGATVTVTVVFTGTTRKVLCNALSLPRFHVLLRMP